MQPDFSQLHVIDPNWQRAFAAQHGPAPMPQKKKGRGGMLSSLISEAGGAGGAAGGAALGTMILPGVGTVIGAGLGGFLGGTAGRGVENKVRDNQNFFGAGGSAKSAFGEGALAGALSGAGAGFQALKGAKAANSVASVLGSDVPGVATQQATRIGGLETAGRNIKSGAMGFGQGATLNGEKIGAATSDNIGKLLKQLKIPAASPEATQRAIEGRLSNLTSTLDSQYKKANVTLSKDELSGLRNKIMEKFGGVNAAGLDPADIKYAQQQVDLLTKNSKNLEDVWNFSKTLTRRKTNFGAKAGGKLADQESVARVVRGEIGDWLNSKVPGLAKTNSLYHRTANANELTKAMSTNVKGGGAVSKLTNLSAVKAGEAKLGAGLENIGKYTAGTGGPVTQVTNNLVRQAPGSVGRAMVGTANQSMDQTQPQDPNQSAVDAFGNPTGSGMGGMQDPSQLQQPDQTQQSPYPLQNAIADIQRDPKNADKYIQYYKFVESATTPSKTAVKAQDAAYAGNQALNIIDQLEQAYNQAGGARGRVGGLASSIAGKAGGNNAVNIYNDNKMAFLSNVARSLGEKGVLTDQDIARIAKAFPSPTANPQEAAAKWAMIRSIISGGLQNAQQSYAVPQNNQYDLSSLMSQYQ